MKTISTILVLCFFLIGNSYSQEKADSLGKLWVKNQREIILLQGKMQNESNEIDRAKFAKHIKSKEDESALIKIEWEDEMCRDNIRNLLGKDVANYDDCELIGAFLEKLNLEIEENQWFCVSLITGDCKSFLEKMAESSECDSINTALKVWLSLLNKETFFQIDNNVIPKYVPQKYWLDYRRMLKEIRTRNIRI